MENLFQIETEYNQNREYGIRLASHCLVEVFKSKRYLVVSCHLTIQVHIQEN